jgi:hypothetical protein
VPEGRSDRLGEFGERCCDPQSGWGVDGEFVVATAEVLHEAASVTISLGVTFNVDSARWKNRRAAPASRRADTSTSMTCPYWSTARYTYRQTPFTLTYVSSTNHLSPGECRENRAASASSGVNRCTHR